LDQLRFPVIRSDFLDRSRSPTGSTALDRFVPTVIEPASRNGARRATRVVRDAWEDGVTDNMEGQVGPMGSDNCVLVVDDEPALRMLMSRRLRIAGYVPVEAGSLPDAIHEAQLHQPVAVILDLGLRAGGSGLDFLVWLRQQPGGDGVLVLILTGRHPLEEHEKALIRGHHAHTFYKPTPFATLLERLDRMTAAPCGPRPVRSGPTTPADESHTAAAPQRSRSTLRPPR
jgi:CheY-like chemotaxis protein